MRVLALLAIVLLSLAFGSIGDAVASGGLMPGWLFARFDGLNERLAAAGLPGLPPGLLLIGAGGVESNPWRVGGWVAYGLREAQERTREVRLLLTLGGPVLEYREPWADGEVFVGWFVGRGTLTLAVTRRTPEDFNSGLQEPIGASLSREMLALMPYAGGEWRIGQLRLGLSLGYLWLASVSGWAVDGRDLPGPLDLLSAPLLRLHLGIAF